jgi:hypothetical protein
MPVQRVDHKLVIGSGTVTLPTGEKLTVEIVASKQFTEKLNEIIAALNALG